MPPPDRSPSPQVFALRAAAESICAQLHIEVRGQQRVIRGSAVGELTATAAQPGPRSNPT